MSLKNVAGLLVVVLLTAIGVRYLWPRVEQVQLPAETIVDTVTQVEYDSIVEERVVFRDRVTTDTVNVVTTRTVTELDTVYVLTPRWYLDWATVAARGDTSRYGMVYLEADSTGIRTRSQLEEHVTIGPVREIRTDSAGLHVEYGAPRRAGVSLPFGLRVPTAAVCGAVGAATFAVGVSLP